MTRPDLVEELERIATVVAGWTGLVPPAVMTGRIAEELRALARDVADDGPGADPAWEPDRVGTANPGIVGSEKPPPQPRA